MNAARGNQVLSLIGSLVSSIESESERLCLLLAEARREKYWTLWDYKSEQQWILATFNELSLRTVRQLARLGLAFEGELGIITDIGTAKADAIKSLHPRNNWVSKARNMTVPELTQHIKDVTLRIRTVLQANKRIELLKAKERNLAERLQLVRDEIAELESAWEGKTVEDSIGCVTQTTIRRWKRIGAMA